MSIVKCFTSIAFLFLVGISFTLTACDSKVQQEIEINQTTLKYFIGVSSSDEELIKNAKQAVLRATQSPSRQKQKNSEYQTDYLNVLSFKDGQITTFDSPIASNSFGTGVHKKAWKLLDSENKVSSNDFSELLSLAAYQLQAVNYENKLVLIFFIDEIGWESNSESWNNCIF